MEEKSAAFFASFSGADNLTLKRLRYDDEDFDL